MTFPFGSLEYHSLRLYMFAKRFVRLRSVQRVVFFFFRQLYLVEYNDFVEFAL